MPLHGVPDDGQAQARPPGGAGAGLVHAVKPLEDPGHIRLRDAHAGVGHGQRHLVPHPAGGHVYLPVQDVVLDGVFHQVFQDLTGVLVVAADQTALSQGQGHGDLGRLGQGGQHPADLFGLLVQVDGPAVQVPALVQAVQLQKLLADVDEAVGGIADVGHKFPRRLPVDGRIL